MPPESKFTQTVYLCGIPDANTAIPEESAWVRSYDASELGWKECLNGPSHLVSPTLPRPLADKVEGTFGVFLVPEPSVLLRSDDSCSSRDRTTIKFRPLLHRYHQVKTTKSAESATELYDRRAS